MVNVSSPNTPGLRALQRRSAIKEVIESAMSERDQVQVLLELVASRLTRVKRNFTLYFMNFCTKC